MRHGWPMIQGCRCNTIISAISMVHIDRLRETELEMAAGAHLNVRADMMTWCRLRSRSMSLVQLIAFVAAALNIMVLAKFSRDGTSSGADAGGDGDPAKGYQKPG